MSRPPTKQATGTAHIMLYIWATLEGVNIRTFKFLEHNKSLMPEKYRLKYYEILKVGICNYNSEI